MYEVKALEKKSRHLKKFINLEFKFYKDDQDWVPPLKGDTKKMLKGKGNPLFENGDQAFFMVYKGKKPVGRVLVGIDEELNRVRGFKQGFFSMFECIDDEDACKALLDASASWLTEKGMERMIGKHGAENVLFGTDSPWRDVELEIRRIRELPLPADDIDKIFYRNALRLLGGRGTVS